MLDFSITHVGVYRKTEKYVQTVHGTWFSFYISGLKYSRTYLPDGRLLREDDSKSDPNLSIRLPGMKIDFEHGAKRENWVVMLKDFPIRYSADMSCAEINLGSWLSVPFQTQLPRERVPGWQIEFKKLQGFFEEPTPLNTCKAKLSVMNILRFMIEQKMDSIGESPEERLKHLIDSDSSFSASIAELSRSCNVSADHLRLLFYKRYRINPQEYRKQRRNAHIMEMIANSTLPLKEIAAGTGFKHISHFCAEFKRQFGISPKEGIRRFRYLHS